MPILFLLFIVVPVVEMFILIKVGGLIGGWYTIGLVVLTAMIGASLLKRQGLAIFINAQQKMQAGQMPVSELAQGLMLAIAGALLLTPGFVTDVFGFILLTPFLRQYFADKVFRLLVSKAQQGQFYSQTAYYSSQQRPTDDIHGSSFDRESLHVSRDIEVIDGEYCEISEEKIEKK